jgi:hypothetical protein
MPVFYLNHCRHGSAADRQHCLYLWVRIGSLFGLPDAPPVAEDTWETVHQGTRLVASLVMYASGPVFGYNVP